ncbi:MAG: carotenoid biosynthesis protein [bacterium]
MHKKHPHIVNPLKKHGVVLYIVCSAATFFFAILFLSADPFSWERMNVYLFLGTLCLAFVTLLHASLTYSVRDALLLFTVSTLFTYINEFMGVRWGIPFGKYAYHSDLHPYLPGGIPFFIILSWFVLAYAPLVFLRWFISGSRGSSKHAPYKKAILCAVALTATDLFLDPLATQVETWEWSHSGFYFGIPIWNFIGWTLIGFLIFWVYFLLGGSKKSAIERGYFSLDGILVVLSILMAFLANLALYKMVNSFVPASVTLITLGPFYAYWFITNHKARTSRDE